MATFDANLVVDTTETAMTPDTLQPGKSPDFDFLYGRWTVHHRRLDERLVGGTSWTEFDGTCVARPLLGGLGNLDENVLDLPSGPYEAATVRLFDPASEQWSIWWIDARHPDIATPMRGTFRDGVGTFFCDDTHGGLPIRVRFLWSDITRDAARWEQAFSTDGERTWEVNWVMHFARAS
jgi:hypothetical protein